ncbi:MAG: flagellar hook-basal body complex protein FliE [Bacillota bacterium]
MDISKISKTFSNVKNEDLSIDSDKKSIDFTKAFNQAIDKVNADQLNADEMDKLLAAGEIDNVQDVVIASQKAQLSLNLAVEVKNKIMEAYDKIMRLQI